MPPSSQYHLAPMNRQTVMTPPDCLFCHFNNYLLKNHWLIYDMTGFDVSQLWARYAICELELQSFPVVGIDFAAPLLPNTVKSKSRGDGGLLTTFTFISREALIYYKVVWEYANVAKFVGMKLFQAYQLTVYKLGKEKQF